MIGTIGYNQIAKDIYKALGFKTGKMRRFLALNPNNNEYKIIEKDNLNKVIKNFSKFNFNKISEKGLKSSSL